MNEENQVESTIEAKGADDLAELGVVSEDTHGYIYGTKWDGGMGWRF